MKNKTLFSLAALTLAGTMMFPMTAMAAPCLQGAANTKMIVVNGNNYDDLKSTLANYGINLDSLKNACNNTNAVKSQTCAPTQVTPSSDSNCGSKTDSNNATKPADTTPAATPASTTPSSSTPASTTPESTTEEKTAKRTYAEQVVDLVNAERKAEGLSALTLDKTIEKAALVRAKEIVTKFSHTRPSGKSFSTALTDAGVSFKGAGENIAWGQKTPEEVVEGWMNSEGHRANIMNAKYTKIGVGYYQNGAGRNYWTQLFTY